MLCSYLAEKNLVAVLFVQTISGHGGSNTIWLNAQDAQPIGMVLAYH
jgi:hypothetical protein